MLLVNGSPISEKSNTISHQLVVCDHKISIFSIDFYFEFEIFVIFIDFKLKQENIESTNNVHIEQIRVAAVQNLLTVQYAETMHLYWWNH